MPRNITVKFADGTTHVYKNAPDDITPEAATARAEKDFGKEVTALDGGRHEAQQPSFIEELGNSAKNVGSGLLKGAIALPQMLAEGTKALEENSGAFKQARAQRIAAGKPVGRTLEEVRAGNRKIDASLYQPKTTAEKFVNSAMQGVGGAATMGPVSKAALGIGAMSGLGSEGAAQAFGDSTMSRIAGGVVGGLGGGLLTSLRTNKADMAQAALKDVRPEDLLQAKKNMEMAASQGVNVNLSQAMPRASNIDTLVDTLANSRYGQKVTEQLREQPAQVAFGMEDQMLKLPGKVREPQIVANNVQSAATGAIQKAQKQATAAWAQHAPLDAKLTPESMSKLDGILKAMEEAYPNTATADMAADVGRAIKNPKAAAKPDPNALLDASGVPFNAPAKQPKYLTDAMQVKGAVDDSLDNFGARKLNTPGLDAKLTRRAQEIRETLRNIVESEAPELAAANRAYSEVTRTVVDPMKKSVVGRIAGRTGSEADREAVRGKITSLFDAGTVPGAKSSEILSLEKALRTVETGPEAFQDGVKTWMAQKISTAAQRQGGRMNDDIAAKLEKVFAGTDTSSQGFKDMMVGLARSQGLKDDALLPGMQKFMKIVGMAARRPGSVSGTTRTHLDEIAGNSALKSVGQFSVITPVRQPILRWMEYLKADAYKAMDDLLTTPEGVDMLMKLGKKPVMSPAAVTTVSTFLATSANAHGAKSPENTGE